MKVYVALLWTHYENSHVMGVRSTLPAAKQFVRDETKHAFLEWEQDEAFPTRWEADLGPSVGTSYVIEEHELELPNASGN